MGFKKDINQLKKTGKMIEEKAPLVAETSKSVFVIVKWILILCIVLVIGALIYAFAFVYPAEKRAEEERKLILNKKAICEQECSGLSSFRPERELDKPTSGFKPFILYESPKEQCYKKCLEREGIK